MERYRIGLKLRWVELLRSLDRARLNGWQACVFPLINACAGRIYLQPFLPNAMTNEQKRILNDFSECMWSIKGRKIIPCLIHIHLPLCLI